MPAEPIHPDQLAGEARFRADLVAYLDSRPAHELASCWATFLVAARSHSGSACS